jgi:uncharacterized membrane protein YdbT with pleckstrin-like domain
MSSLCQLWLAHAASFLHYNAQPAKPQAEEERIMGYVDRPALRNQWGAILLVTCLLGLLVVFWNDARRTGISADSGFLLAALAVPILVLCLLISYRRLSWRYTIEDGVIESRHGIIAREVRSVRVEDVRSLNVKQNVWQRLLNLGDIEFNTAASSDVEVVFYGVSNPLKVKEEIQSML